MFSGTSVPGARTLRTSSPRWTESMITSARATEGGRASSWLSATVSITAAMATPAISKFRFVFLGGSLLISTGTGLAGSWFDTYYGGTVEKESHFFQRSEGPVKLAVTGCFGPRMRVRGERCGAKGLL